MKRAAMVVTVLGLASFVLASQSAPPAQSSPAAQAGPGAARAVTRRSGAGEAAAAGQDPARV